MQLEAEIYEARKLAEFFSISIYIRLIRLEHHSRNNYFC